jgi:hypothetical protein
VNLLELGWEGLWKAGKEGKRLVAHALVRICARGDGGGNDRRELPVHRLRLSLRYGVEGADSAPTLLPARAAEEAGKLCEGGLEHRLAERRGEAVQRLAGDDPRAVRILVLRGTRAVMLRRIPLAVLNFGHQRDSHLDDRSNERRRFANARRHSLRERNDELQPQLACSCLKRAVHGDGEHCAADFADAVGKEAGAQLGEGDERLERLARELLLPHSERGAHHGEHRCCGAARRVDVARAVTALHALCHEKVARRAESGDAHGKRGVDEACRERRRDRRRIREQQRAGVVRQLAKELEGAQALRLVRMRDE